MNKKIKKIIFNQNVLGNCTKSRRTRHNCLRKYYWIIYKLYKWRSWTNLNVLTAKRNNHILSFSIWFWAPISEVLLFLHLPTSSLPLRPELTTTFAFLSAKISPPPPYFYPLKVFPVVLFYHWFHILVTSQFHKRESMCHCPQSRERTWNWKRYFLKFNTSLKLCGFVNESFLKQKYHQRWK